MNRYVEDMPEAELLVEQARLSRIMREAPMALTCGEADQISDRLSSIGAELELRRARR